MIKEYLISFFFIVLISSFSLFAADLQEVDDRLPYSGVVVNNSGVALNQKYYSYEFVFTCAICVILFKIKYK